MNTDVLPLKLERKLWACNAWHESKSGNVYQYSDRFQTTVTIHRRKSGQWGIGELGSTTRQPTWGPAYTFPETAVWKSFEWLYQNLPVCIDDDFYIKFKLLDSLKSAYERPGFTTFGILEGAEFTLELRDKVKWVNLVAEHRAVRGQCREHSFEYKRRVKDKWSPNHPNNITTMPM